MAMVRLFGVALLLGAWCSAGAARAAGDAADAGDEIVVTGALPDKDAAAGTKAATPIVETPQSISIVSGATIAELGLQNLNQVLRAVAGVTPETRGANADFYDLFKLRGFDAPRYLDGLKTFTSPTGYADTQIDVSRLDRVEIVKGPASVLYGQSSPGGLIALASKLPLDRVFYGAVSGTYGTYDLYRVDADAGGRFGPGLLWRAYGSANGAATQQSFGKRRRETASAAITAGAGTATSLTLLAAWSHDPENGNYGTAPAIGTLFPNPNGRIATRFADGEPGDRFRREQAGATYILRHDFGGGWAFRSSGRYQSVSTDLGAVYTTGTPVDATLTTFGRGSYATRERLDDWTFDDQIAGMLATGPIRHGLLFGADRQVAHSTEAYAFGSATDINAYAPVYGTMAVPRVPADVPDAFSGLSDVHQRQQGLYAQDQMALGGLRVTISGRQDWSRGAMAGRVQHDAQFTYRVGSLYLTPIGLAPYASYSTSFEPQSGTLEDGSLSKPSLGRQIEAGLKYQQPGGDTLITLSWFDIEQTNLLTAIPNSSFSTQAGRVRSRGIELEGRVPLPAGFRIDGAISRQRIRVLDDTVAANVGRPLIGAGRGNAAVTLSWQAPATVAPGFSIGGTIRHVDHVYGGASADGATGYSTPDYTLADAFLHYDLGRALTRLNGVAIGINATNLFDRKYLTSCYLNGVGWCWYGQRRTVQGTIGLRW